MALLYWPTSYAADFVYLMCPGFREGAAGLPSSKPYLRPTSLQVWFPYEGYLMRMQRRFYTFFFLSDRHLLVDHKSRCLRQMNNKRIHHKSTKYVWGLKQGCFYDLLVTQFYSCCTHRDQCFKNIINSLTHQGKIILEKPFRHTHPKSCLCLSTFQVKYIWHNLT